MLGNRITFHQKKAREVAAHDASCDVSPGSRSELSGSDRIQTFSLSLSPWDGEGSAFGSGERLGWRLQRLRLEPGAGSGRPRENPGGHPALVFEERGGDKGHRIKQAGGPEGKSPAA